jgi:hypothetical protein
MILGKRTLVIKVAFPDIVSTASPKVIDKKCQGMIPVRSSTKFISKRMSLIKK